MKNIKVYIGTIKECLDTNGYKKYGDERTIERIESQSMTTLQTVEITTRYTKIINNQAVIIKNKSGHYYEFKLTNTIKDNLKIIFDDIDYSLKTTPEKEDDLFIEKSTLVEYYKEQPKRLSLRKLKMDLLLDPRIKSGIEH